MRGLEMLDPEARASALPSRSITLPDPAMEVDVEPERLTFERVEKPAGVLRGAKMRLNGESRGSYPLGNGKTACLFHDESKTLFARVTSVHTMDIHWYKIEGAP